MLYQVLIKKGPFSHISKKTEDEKIKLIDAFDRSNFFDSFTESDNEIIYKFINNVGKLMKFKAGKNFRQITEIECATLKK